MRGNILVQHITNTEEAMEQGRYVFFDTETTGLKPQDGHRIVEIGAVEVIDRQITGKYYHCLVNPQRDSDERAIEVHGHTNESLKDKPLFNEVFEDMCSFFNGAILVAHNANFDISFLDVELERIEGNTQRARDRWTFIDSLAVAQKLHPGQANSLDALCRRYYVDASKRVKHGALIDSELLAEVYIAMTSFQMSVLDDDPATIANSVSADGAEGKITSGFLPIPSSTRKIRVDAVEEEAHRNFLTNKIKDQAPFGDW